MPKHHHRLHIAQHAMHFGCFLSTIVGESRHRDFTAEIGDRMDAFAKQGLALHVLPHLLDNQVRQLQEEENSGLRSGIRKPCKDHANCIARLPNWLQCESCSTGRRLVLDCNTISEGDLLLSEDFAQGFLVRACCSAREYCVLAETLEKAACLHKLSRRKASKLYRALYVCV